MNKNLLAVAVATAMTMPVVASAAFSAKGDARYILDINSKTTGKDTVTKSDHDWRARVTTTYTNKDNVKVILRMVADSDPADTVTPIATGIDRAYLVAPIAGMQVSAGRMKAHWGLGFQVNDETRSRIKVAKPMGAMTVFGIFDKLAENTNGGTKDAMDKDAYTVGAIGKAGGMTWGTFVTSVTESNVDGMDANTAVAATGTTPVVDAVDAVFDTKPSTINMNFFVKTKVGNIALSSEFAKIEDATGLVAMGTMPVGSMSITGALATTSEGFTADSDFTPFGGLDGTYKVYNSVKYKIDDKKSVFGANTAFGVNVAMPLGGMKAVVGFASATMGGRKDNGTNDATATIVHAKISKSLGKQTSVYGKLGTVGMASGDIEGSSMSAGIKLKF